MALTAPQAILGAAGLDFAGGLFGRSKPDTSLSEKWNKKAYEHSRDVLTKGIRYRVADAKAAGIHPLYAMGASMSSSPSFTVAGQHESGSALGAGISAASRGLQNMARHTPGALAQRVGDSQVLRNEAEATYLLSKAKRAEAEANLQPAAAAELFAVPELFRDPPISRRDMRSLAAFDRARVPGFKKLLTPSEKVFGDDITSPKFWGVLGQTLPEVVRTWYRNRKSHIDYLRQRSFVTRRKMTKKGRERWSDRDWARYNRGTMPRWMRDRGAAR